MSAPPSVHVPVLLDAALALLSPQPGDRCCDATLGGGGYSRRLLASCRPGGFLLACDHDPAACEAARASADLGAAADVRIVSENFARLVHLDEVADGFDVCVADLGVSSLHLDDPARGFSFLRDGPLDMRMDPRLPWSAADLIARESEEALADIIYRLGEEGRSRRIARAIVRARAQAPISTTGALAEIVLRALGGRHGPRHPATRVFQALRCAVNREPENLEAFLKSLPRLVRPGGRVAILAYHSLEDRPVKQAFRAMSDAGGWTLLTKKAAKADRDEMIRNPRSRSVRLRVLRREK